MASTLPVVTVMLLLALQCELCVDARVIGVDILLDPKDLAKTGDLRNTIATIKKIGQALVGCGVKESSQMRRRSITNRTVTCNDGSAAGYYLRKSKGSKRWIVFLEGGWYCFHKASCDARWLKMRNLMSSTYWPETRLGEGILSADPEENPDYWNANTVMIPYCSSDSWSGAKPAAEKGDWAFMGSLIIQEVMKDLLQEGLQHGRKLLMVGSSAGGTGVILNVDRIADLLRPHNPRLDVRGLTDSGWFLDNEPFKPVECTDAHLCSPIESVKLGISYWNGQVPERCQEEYPTEHWRCYFGYRAYNTMRAPLFVFQWLYDEAQMTVDNVGPPVTKDQWDYIHGMGNELKATFQNVSAMFAASCLSHIVLTKKEWQYVEIDGVTLPQALRCWMDASHEHNHHKHHRNHNEFDVLASTEVMLSDQAESAAAASASASEPTRQRSRLSKQQRRQERLSRRQRTRNRKSKARNRQQTKRAATFEDDEDFDHRWRLHNSRCRHRLIDRCAWPQCNQACPKLRNPFTGEEMDFIDLLKSFGLDMTSVANALGMDVALLNSMDHDQLLQLLAEYTRRR